MKRILLLLVLVPVLYSTLSIKASADHLPSDKTIKWGVKSINRMWAVSFPDDVKRSLVRQIQAHDPGCFSNTCNTNYASAGSWARWYIDEKHPHVSLADNPTRPEYKFRDPYATGVCSVPDNRLSIHWENLTNPQDEFIEAGVALRCPFIYTSYSCSDPTKINDPGIESNAHYASEEINCPPPKVVTPYQYTIYAAAGMSFTANLADFGTQWHFGGAGNIPPANKLDFMSIVTHEMGHVYGLLHYPVNTNGYSTDESCVKAGSNDPAATDNKRATMCVPAANGTKRQVTPEYDEKNTFKAMY